MDHSKSIQGEVSWQCPSNIAIIKYWGKYGEQLPKNPSISFTLSQCHTTISIQYAQKKGEKSSIDFLFEGNRNEKFAAKIIKFITNLYSRIPVLENLDLMIQSKNSFPHSTGIASSASAMGALALCLVQIENQIFNLQLSNADFLKKASFFARLGSGSACRSIYPVMAAWGESKFLPPSNNEYAVSCQNDVHPIFHTFQDCILITDSSEKKVSSRAGHGLMENNPYADIRYQEANERFGNLLTALKTGDVAQFGAIAEAEALTLHALMMASNPPYLLIRPNTIAMINAIQNFRNETGLPIYFTLDAGPNIHLLYPDHIKNEVELFINTELKQFCEGGRFILDSVGWGPIDLINH